MKNLVYVLTNENGKEIARSGHPMHGWTAKIIDTEIESMIKKYRTLCESETTEEGKNEVRKAFVEVRRAYLIKEAKEKQAWLQKVRANKDKNTPKRYSWVHTKSTTPKNNTVSKFWELDNLITNKETGEKEMLTKKVVDSTGDKAKPWKWTPYVYDDIREHEYYSKLKVHFKTKTLTIAECIDTHKEYHSTALTSKENGNEVNYQKYRTACAKIKTKIDNTLDTASQLRQKELTFSPERRIEMVDNEIPDDDTIIACYPLQATAYHGDINEIDCSVTLQHIGVDYSTGEDMYRWNPDGVVINSNGDLKFNNLICHPQYSWLYGVIEKAKTFDYTPNLIEGFYNGGGGTQVIKVGDNSYREIPQGVRGMCITYKAAKELQAIVNWCEGNADLGDDYSDTTTIHHNNRVDFKTITKYEYHNHREDYLDWTESDTRDFQCPIYNAELDVAEYAQWLTVNTTEEA